VDHGKFAQLTFCFPGTDELRNDAIESFVNHSSGATRLTDSFKEIHYQGVSFDLREIAANHPYSQSIQIVAPFSRPTDPSYVRFSQESV